MRINSLKKTIVLTALSQLLAAIATSNLFAFALDLDQMEKKSASGTLTNGQAMELQEFCQKHPDDTKAHVVLGRFYSRYNFGELASLEFESALKANKDQPEVWVMLINEKYRHTKVDDAQQVLARAEKVCPDDPRLLLVKGLLLARLNQPGEAEVCLARAQAAQPKNPEVYRARGEVLCMLGRPQEALRAAGEALLLEPRYVGAFIIRARALLMMNDDFEAFRQLGFAFHFNPFEHGLAQMYMEQAERQKYYGLALEAALMAMGMDVHHDAILYDRKVDVIRLMSMCKARGATDNEIVKLVEKVSDELVGTGHQAKYLFCLGDIYDSFEKPEQAVSFYRAGLEIDPVFSRAWFRLAEDLERFRNYDEAMKCYRKAYSLDKQDQEIVAGASRFERRMAERSNDLAWLLRDLIFDAYKRGFHALD